MSSLKDRRSSPRREPPEDWPFGVFIVGFVLCAGVVTLVTAMILGWAIEPRPCAKIASVIAIAGDCR